MEDYISFIRSLKCRSLRQVFIIDRVFVSLKASEKIIQYAAIFLYRGKTHANVATSQ